jgi:hypothetical protein
VPFTPSHAAAVLPFVRLLPGAALVVGSMSPDLPYFVPVGLNPGTTHAPWGAVTVDVAVSLVVLAVWYGVVARPAVAAAPTALRARLHGAWLRPLPPRLRSPAWVVSVVVATALGALTHVVWDAFTHPNRWGTEHVGALTATYAGQPGWQWAQYLSSAVGLVVVAAWLLHWWRVADVVPEGSQDDLPARLRGRVVALVVGGTVGVAAVTALVAAVRAADLGAKGMVFAAVTRGGSVALVLLLAAAVAWHLERAR